MARGSSKSSYSKELLPSVQQTIEASVRYGRNESFINVRNIVPRDANSKACWWISKPTIIGAMAKQPL